MKITRTIDYELIARLNKPILELHASLYPQHFTEYNFEATQDSFKQWVTNDNFIFLLLEDNDESIGFAWVEIKNYIQTAFKKPYRSVYVHQINIIEKQTSRGYGSHLMNNIYGIAKSEGIELVELDYWVNNERAKNFYEKQGFMGYREFVYKKI